MSDDDHTLIARTAESMAEAHDGVVIVHGTDTLTVTGERLALNGSARSAGADHPDRRDAPLRAAQHRRRSRTLIESLLAVQIVDPGVYVVHAQLASCGSRASSRTVIRGTFERKTPSETIPAGPTRRDANR